MNRHTRIGISSIALLMLVLQAQVHADTPAERLMAVPVPHGTRLLSAGADVVQNGNPMALASFDVSLPVDETRAFYRQLWSEPHQENLPALVENQAGNWFILGRLEAGYSIVLQLDLARADRSTGYLSVMQVAQDHRARPEPEDFPGLQRLSTTVSNDELQLSTLSVYSSSESVETLARRFASQLQGQDWVLVSEEGYAQSKVLLLSRRSAQKTVVISALSGSTGHELMSPGSDALGADIATASDIAVDAALETGLDAGLDAGLDTGLDAGAASAMAGGSFGSTLVVINEVDDRG